MTRLGAAKPIDLEDDEFYPAVLMKPEKGWIQTSNHPTYGKEPQVVVRWKVKDGTLTDYLSIRLGQKHDGTIAKLRQLVNALSERPKEAEVWFDPELAEWGYDMGEGTPPFASLELMIGHSVLLRGENRKNGGGNSVFKIAAYKSAKEKAKEKVSA